MTSGAFGPLGDEVDVSGGGDEGPPLGGFEVVGLAAWVGLPGVVIVECVGC